MSGDIPTGVIGAIGGAVRRLFGRFMSAYSGDYAAKRAEKREAVRTRAETHRGYILRVQALLADASPDGDFTSTAERGYRELPGAAEAVADPDLTAAIGLMLASPRGGPDWTDAHGNATRRVGVLLSELP